MHRRDIEIKVLARQLPGAGRHSAACIGVAAVLAVFIVAFATTSRSSAEVGSPMSLSTPFVGKAVAPIAELPGRP